MHSTVYDPINNAESKISCTYFELSIGSWRIQLDCWKLKILIEVMLLGNELGDLDRSDLVGWIRK